jgi:hypothetical protein
MAENNPVIGFVRYSLKENSWKKSKDIFEEKYFNYRFEIFKNITLKSFQNQNDMNFMLFLLHSANMPQEYQEQFNQLERENSFLRNVYLRDGEEALQEFLLSTNQYIFSGNVSVNFRIDNDDGIPSDFISRLRGYCKSDFAGHAISIPNIYVVQRISKDKFFLQKRNLPGNSIGFAYITGKNNYKTIIGFGDHGLIIKNMPTILLPEQVQGGIQTINGGNVTNGITVHGKLLGKFTKSQLNEYLNEHFNIEPDCLKICRTNIIILFFIFIKPAIKYLIRKILKLW